MKKLRVLVMMHEDLIPPDDVRGLSEKKISETKTEYDILWALEELGHRIYTVGLRDDLEVLRKALKKTKPDIVFNVLEEFHDVTAYGQALINYLELCKQAYTGCNPRGMLLGHDKLTTKQILSYHGIPVARGVVFEVGTKFREPGALRYPMFVKSSFEDASLGISQKSIVHTAAQLERRVAYMHKRFGTGAIVEEFIEGRELYLGLIGNKRVENFPVWEMKFNRWPADVPRIATEKVKWDYAFQLKHDIQTEPAELPPDLNARCVEIGRRVWSALGLSGYARLDLRLTPEGEVYVIEANPNPDLAHDEDFAKSAKAGGLDYPELIAKILKLGMKWQPKWREEELRD